MNDEVTLMNAVKTGFSACTGCGKGNILLTSMNNIPICSFLNQWCKKSKAIGSHLGKGRKYFC